MFVSLRLGMLVRVVLVAAGIAALLMLVLSVRTQPGASQPENDRDSSSSSVKAAERQGETRYRVSGTGGAGLNVRACPDVDCAKVGWLDEGEPFLAECWEQGTAVSGNRMWLAGSVGGREGYASGHYLRPGTGVGAPACEDPASLAQ